MRRTLLALSLSLAGTALAAEPPGKPATARPTPAVRLQVSVTSDGFVVAEPRALKVGQAVTLVVTRTEERTCATDIVLKEFGISRPLPLGSPVEVTFTPSKKGTVHFSCAMDMVAGDLAVE